MVSALACMDGGDDAETRGVFGFWRTNWDGALEGMPGLPIGRHSVVDGQIERRRLPRQVPNPSENGI